MIPDYVRWSVAAGHGPRAHPPWAPSPRGRGAREGFDHSAVVASGRRSALEDPSPALRAPSPHSRGARGRIATSEDSDERQRESTPTT